mmetsp:Transcript_1643/g.2367  ORF Transcript_1643/g.2367 Transcript_1643/m.2367 type:complete len:453 (+) Transcript_1643:319-1677(+)
MRWKLPLLRTSIPGVRYLCGVLQKSSSSKGTNESDAANDVKGNVHEAICVIRRLGKGVMWYFKFGRFMILYNLLLTCIAAISWFTSLGVGPRFEETSFLFPGTFYISTYASATYPVYVFSVTLMLICCFALGPAYRYYVLWYEELQVVLRNKAAADGGDVNWVEDEYEGQYGNEHFEFVNEEAIDKIEYDFQMKTRYSPLGVLLSATLMLVILCVSGVITFYLQRASRQVGGNALASFFIAAFIAIIGFTWEYLCNTLTKLEYWAYWSDYFKSTCVKVLLFKILNIFTVFLVKRIEFQEDESNTCQLEELATQFFILLGFNTSATVANMIFVSCFTDPNEERSPDGWREFILSQEYVELVYRQFLVHLGFLLAPMMAIFAVMATVLEYGFDKYRLLRVCHKPKATKSSFRGVLAFYFFLSALFVMFSFPNGAIFVLAGSFGLADSDTCFIYQ